jgi:hypothetical protein
MFSSVSHRRIIKKIYQYVLSVDIKSWDIQNLLIVSQTFELSLKIKIVIKELNFNLMFLTICHNFHNLICKKPNLHNVYF